MDLIPILTLAGVLFTLTGILAYVSYKQQVDNNNIQRQQAAAQQVTAQATAETAAPTSVSEAADTPVEVTTGGVLGKHKIYLGDYRSLFAPVWARIETLCDTLKLLSSSEGVNSYKEDTDKAFKDTSQNEQVYQCTYKGTEFRIYFTKEKMAREKVKNDNFPLPEEGEVEVMLDCKLSLPLSDDPEINKAFVNLREEFKNEYRLAAVEVVRVSSQAKLNSITHLMYDNVAQKWDRDTTFATQANEIPAALLDLSYKLDPIGAGSDVFDPPPSVRMVNSWRPKLQSGHNIAIIGKHGSGKTKLIEAIVAGLDDFNLLYLDDASLPVVVQNPAMLKKIAEQKKLVVVYDEAQALTEEAKVGLLQLMEGNKSVKGVSFILGLNTDVVDGALLRPGRVDEIIQLRQISKGSARKLCAYVVDHNKGVSLNMGILNSVLIGDDAKFSLAQVYSALGEKDLMDQINDAYKPYKIPAKAA